MNIFKQKEREFAIQRLPFLKKKFPESSQLLEFLECILKLQNDIIEDLSERGVDIDTSNAEKRIEKGKTGLKLSEINWEPYLVYLYEFLDRASECGTPEIESGAYYLKNQNKDDILSILSYFLENQIADDVSRMIFVSFLQPILYTVSDKISFNKDQWLKNYCPVCGFKPSVSFLMDTEEWEGARFLRCSLCLTDWLYIRTKCVNCGNVEDNKMDYFMVQDFDYIKIQACQKCNHYIKIIDLRKDGFAVPDLEDIASVSLDLWAQEKGYTKFERNLFGF